MKLTIEQAIDCLPEGEMIHVFKNHAFGLIGCDWEREDLISEMTKADDLQIGGEQCRAMKHGLVVFPQGAEYQSQLLFVETVAEKIEKFLEGAWNA